MKSRILKNLNKDKVDKQMKSILLLTCITSTFLFFSCSDDDVAQNYTGLEFEDKTSTHIDIKVPNCHTISNISDVHDINNDGIMDIYFEYFDTSLPNNVYPLQVHNANTIAIANGVHQGSSVYTVDFCNPTLVHKQSSKTVIGTLSKYENYSSIVNHYNGSTNDIAYLHDGSEIGPVGVNTSNLKEVVENSIHDLQHIDYDTFSQLGFALLRSHDIDQNTVDNFIFSKNYIDMGKACTTKNIRELWCTMGVGNPELNTASYITPLIDFEDFTNPNHKRIKNYDFVDFDEDGDLDMAVLFSNNEFAFIESQGIDVTAAFLFIDFYGNMTEPIVHPFSSVSSLAAPTTELFQFGDFDGDGNESDLLFLEPSSDPAYKYEGRLYIDKGL